MAKTSPDLADSGDDTLRIGQKSALPFAADLELETIVQVYEIVHEIPLYKLWIDGGFSQNATVLKHF